MCIETNRGNEIQERTGINDPIDTLLNIKYVRLEYQTIYESKVGVEKSFTENIRDYKSHNKGNSNYQITNSKEITDDIAEISKLAFNHKIKDVDANTDIKGIVNKVAKRRMLRVRYKVYIILLLGDVLA